MIHTSKDTPGTLNIAGGWEQEIDKKMTLDALVALISRIYTRKIMLDVNPKSFTREPKPHLIEP